MWSEFRTSETVGSPDIKSCLAKAGQEHEPTGSTLQITELRHGKKKNRELCRVNTIEMALACIRTPQAEVLK
jgi:hypothetical protein